MSLTSVTSPTPLTEGGQAYLDAVANGVVVERYVGPREWDAPAYVERIRRLLASP